MWNFSHKLNVTRAAFAICVETEKFQRGALSFYCPGLLFIHRNQGPSEFPFQDLPRPVRRTELVLRGCSRREAYLTREVTKRCLITSSPRKSMFFRIWKFLCALQFEIRTWDRGSESLSLLERRSKMLQWSFEFSWKTIYTMEIPPRWSRGTTDFARRYAVSKRLLFNPLKSNLFQYQWFIRMLCLNIYCS